MSGSEHVKKAAALRGQGKFDEAIAVVNDNRKDFDEVSLLPALLQAFYAAKEKNDEKVAREFAAEIVEIEPGLPSLKGYV